jgi:dethiobiotin synthetase
MSVKDDLFYWKPIQSGLEEGTDSQVVQRISECNPQRILPEAYKLQRPLSPHLSAQLENVTINLDDLEIPKKDNIIIETAGGVLTPINETTLQIDLIKKWKIPVIIASRSSLGTINHSLLTIEALRNRNIEIAGCVMIGESNIHNEDAVKHYGGIKMLGTIPFFKKLSSGALQEIYKKKFTQLWQR